MIYLNKLFIVFLFVGLVMAGSIAEAHYPCGTHYLTPAGENAVDAGEIRWGGSTQYSWEWGDSVDAWNNLGAVNIAPDNIYTYQDLTLGDVDNYYLGWWGAYDYDYFGSDSLTLNKYYMDGGSYGNRAHIVSHELGHVH